LLLAWSAPSSSSVALSVASWASQSIGGCLLLESTEVSRRADGRAATISLDSRMGTRSWSS
jgi:hypothetical protein